MTDLEIIAAIKNKQNIKAFGALYKGFPAIKKMIIANNGLIEDAEDVFQESLIVLCSRINEGRFEYKSQLSTYLYSVCRFLWNDELKKRNKTNLTVTETYLSSSSSSSDNNQIDLSEEEHKAKLAEKTLNTLGDRCKELLLLFYTKAMKLQDIAVKMGYSSENTVKNQKYKCLEMAKKNLKTLQQEQPII